MPGRGGVTCQGGVESHCMIHVLLKCNNQMRSTCTCMGFTSLEGVIYRDCRIDLNYWGEGGREGGWLEFPEIISNKMTPVSEAASMLCQKKKKLCQSIPG